MQPQAKGTPELPEAGRSKDSPPPPRWQHSPTNTLTSDFGLQNHRIINVCCFKPRSLWGFVSAAPRKEYTLQGLKLHLHTQLGAENLPGAQRGTPRAHGRYLPGLITVDHLSSGTKKEPTIHCPQSTGHMGSSVR